MFWFRLRKQGTGGHHEGQLHACAACAALHTVVLLAPKLQMLDVSDCSALTTLALATPALRELEAAGVRPLLFLPQGYLPQWPVTRLGCVLYNRTGLCMMHCCCACRGLGYSDSFGAFTLSLLGASTVKRG